VPNEERIIGGAPVEQNSIPWQAAVLLKGRPNNAFCGGTIISSRFVMTAAHCVFEVKTRTQPCKERRRFDAKELVVLAGEHDLLDNFDGATSHNLKEINTHGQYDCERSNDYDFSILELVDTIDLTGSSKARAACLPNAEDIAFPSGTNFVVSGWGKRDDGTIGGELHHVAVPHVDDATCRRAYGGQITPRMVCAGNFKKGGIGSCMADSGGPLTWVDPNSSRAKLIGVVSWGSNACGEPYAVGVYAEVTTVLPWVYDTTSITYVDNVVFHRN